MQANWSLILNVLLLIGVVIAIGRVIKTRHQRSRASISQPSLGKVENKLPDDIIVVRKVNVEQTADNLQADTSSIAINPNAAPIAKKEKDEPVVVETGKKETHKPIMIFLQAKDNRKLAGYELLQTVLAAGLRFGEGHLFHRHQYPNGQGPVLCSLAAATASGVFDLQNIGAFSVRGLCLFMSVSGNSTIDVEHFNIMLATAKQLSEGLDTLLLDEQQRLLTDDNIASYYHRLEQKKKTKDFELA